MVNHSPLRFREEELTPTTEALAEWCFDRMSDVASGTCPSCHGEMAYTVDTIVVAQGAGEAGTQGAPRKIVCRCTTTHLDDEGKDHSGCGRYWYVRILTDGTEPAIIPETDSALKPLAERFAATDPKSQEDKVRAAAEKWVGAVTALLGLFGLSGIAFGKDAVAGLGTDLRWVFAVALLVAVCTASLAVLRIYRAAYGWPHTVDVSNVRGLKKWNRERRAAPGKAADNLRAGVYLALSSVLALCVGAGVVLWSGLHTHAALIEVTRADDSRVCGELLDSTPTAKLRIRRADGTVDTPDAARLQKLSSVTKCDS